MVEPWNALHHSSYNATHVAPYMIYNVVFKDFFGWKPVLLSIYELDNLSCLSHPAHGPIFSGQPLPLSTGIRHTVEKNDVSTPHMGHFFLAGTTVCDTMDFLEVASAVALFFHKRMAGRMDLGTIFILLSQKIGWCYRQPRKHIYSISCYETEAVTIHWKVAHVCGALLLSSTLLVLIFQIIVPWLTLLICSNLPSALTG